MAGVRLLFGFALAASIGFAAGVPKFEDFPARVKYTGPVAKPKMVNWWQRNYRSTILAAAQGPVNFAGSLLVAEAGRSITGPTAV